MILHLLKIHTIVGNASVLHRSYLSGLDKLGVGCTGWQLAEANWLLRVSHLPVLGVLLGAALVACVQDALGGIFVAATVDVVHLVLAQVILAILVGNSLDGSKATGG